MGISFSLACCMVCLLTPFHLEPIWSYLFRGAVVMPGLGRISCNSVEIPGRVANPVSFEVSVPFGLVAVMYM